MKAPQFVYKAVILKIVDGDTIDVEIDLGFHVFTKQRLRLCNIDAFEKNDKDPLKRALALKATNRVNELIPVGSAVILESFKQDKYGRFLAEVYSISPPSNSINAILVEENLAVPYFGGKK